MDCERCAGEMSAYLDGELSPPVIDELESHLHLCQPCAQELSSLKASALFVEDHSPELSVRPELWNRIHQRVMVPQERRNARVFEFFLAHRWPALAFASALAILVTAGIGGVLQYRENERALLQYMSACMHDRDRQEELEKARAEKARLESTAEAELQPDSSDNPFVTATFGSDDNPFRSEEQ